MVQVRERTTASNFFAKEISSIRHLYNLGLCAVLTVQRQDCWSLIQNSQIVFANEADRSEIIKRDAKFVLDNLVLHSATAEKPLEVSIAHYAQFSSDCDFRFAAARDVLDMVFKGVVIKLYETLVDATKQEERIKEKIWKSDWFMYLWFVRNAFAHNFKWAFEHNAKHLPLMWNGKTISKDMEGKKISTQQIDYYDLWTLLQTAEKNLLEA